MFRNLTTIQGKEDGIFIGYMKDGKFYTVALTKEQAELLDISIAVPFTDSKMYVDFKNELVLKKVSD